MKRHILCHLMLALFAAAPAQAALDYTGACEDDLNTTERRLFERAFAFVHTHRFRVFDEIAADRAGPNEHLYTFIDDDQAEAWRTRIERMAEGDIAIDCHHNIDTPKCQEAPGLHGWYTHLSGRIDICIDNIQAQGQSESADTALVANSMAHEVMHIVDGNEDHGGDGMTEPWDPDSSAVTIGVAIEHMMASPELWLEVPYTVTNHATVGPNGITVHVSGRVHNSNLRSGGWTPSSGDDRNAATSVCLLVDGTAVDIAPVPELAGGESHPFDLTRTFAYADLHPNAAFEVMTDCSEDLVETNEANNRDDLEVAFRPDLKLEVEVDGPPQRVQVASRPSVIYAYRTTWRLRVTQRSAVPSLPSRLRVRQGAGLGQERWIADLPSLQRGGVFETTFTANLPEVFQAPAQFEFQAGDADLLRIDAQPANNRVLLTLDATAWRPDLRAAQTLSFDALNTTRLRVENFGYRAAPSSQLRVYDEAGTLVLSRLIRPLAVREVQTMDLDLAHPECASTPYRVVVDALNEVRESNEHNNTLTARAGQICVEIADPDGPATPEIEVPDL